MAVVEELIRVENENGPALVIIHCECRERGL